MRRAAVEGIFIGSMFVPVVVLTPLPLWAGVVIVAFVAVGWGRFFR